MSLFCSRVAAVVVCLFAFSQLAIVSASAQAPVALPYTMTTIGGQSPMSATPGTQCPGLPAGEVSTDAYGDGCLAINGIFGAVAYGGTLVDSNGNIYVVDDISGPPVVHKINPATGIMTKVAGGGGTACSGKHSSYGDGCVAATNTALVSERSGNVDYYGNILLGGYNSHLVHMICINASPICVSGTPNPTAANPLQIQIGNMDVVAGCAGNAGGQGSSGIGIENSPGFTYPTYSLSTFQNSSSCNTTNLNQGEVDKPEGITGDVYGNIYYADSAASRWRVVLGPYNSTYFTGNNPLWAALEKNAAWYDGTTKFLTAGYVYTISGYPGAAPTTAGVSCGGTATDGFGDGCLFTSSDSMGLAGYPDGMGVDAAGNMVYTDNTRGLRVFYVSDGTNFAPGTAGYIAGQRMMNAIIANINGYTGWTTVNATTNPPPTGFNYMLAGNVGKPAIGSTTQATLGSQLSFDNKMYKLAVSPQGHIYIGDSGGPARVYFYDINTGYIRTLFTGSANLAKGSFCSGSSGPVSLDAYSDGCPATKSLFSNSNSMSVGVDPQGNLYMYDGTEPVIRKVLAQGFSPQTISTPATPLTQTFQVHIPETGTVAVTGATASVTSSPDIVAVSGTNPTNPACAQNGDNTVDCTVTVTTTPSAVGQRSAALTVALPNGTSSTIALNETISGSVMAVDNASLGGAGIALTAHAILSGNTLVSSVADTAPNRIAVDGAGNVYEATDTKTIVESIGGTPYTLKDSTHTPISLPDTVYISSQIAVDALGNVFAVNREVNSISELAIAAAGTPAVYSLSSISYTPCTSCTAQPQAVAADQFGNLYVADYQGSGSSVYRLSLSPLTQQYQNQVTVASGLGNPVSLAVDPSGNVFVADKGTGEAYRLTPGVAGGYTQTTAVQNVTPDAIAVDAAGDVYVADLGTVREFPVSGPTSAGVTVLTEVSSPAGLAVDGLGNVYSADASTVTNPTTSIANPAVTQVVRGAATADFGTSETTAYTATLTNAGNISTTASATLGNVILSAGSGGSPCTIANTGLLGPMTSGQACTISAEMFGALATSGPMPSSTNILEFTSATSTVGSLQFKGTLPQGVVSTTTTTIGGPTTAVYSADGTELTFTVTVSATPGVAPTNNVSVTVDTTTTTPSLNSNGVATVALSGLKVGSHTISAQYPSNGDYTGSSAAPQSFSITQASTSVSGWTPGAATQPVSQAIGASVLNAAASSSDTSVTSVPGNFVYTALCTSADANCVAQYPGATVIDASTYLPIGTYTLSATFVPADTTDYSSSTIDTLATPYTVTQFAAVPALGASTNVVAADGSGNYTSLSAALTALPTTGGTIYIAPGTYTGQNAISYPNVFLRGLGGDPTKVILTGENGNFALNAYPQSSGTAFGPGPAGKAGDEGSATLDVSKNGYPSGSYSPAGFYAEYLTIQNSYDTDLATTSTTTAGGNGGTCTFTGSTPYSLQYLYNNNMECGSQAQALFINADQAILNNVSLISQQDTLYAGYQGTSGSNLVPSRQYIWKGMITGDVDYIYGDAALVMDHTNIFTTWHGTAATGTETITAQNKRVPTTGGAGDYLSGYVCNVCTLMSQTSTANGGAMTKLYYGRPYGVYSTFVLLNSFVDQVAPAGWIGWDGASEYLNTSTYAEYNTQPYTDPAVGTPPYPSILFYPTTGAGGVIPSGGNNGSGATSFGSRESSALHLTAGQAAPYFPVAFLSSPVSTTGGYTGMPTTWNPVATLATAVNSYVPAGNSLTLNSPTSSVTILGRPQTPGAGMIPTGTYTFDDSLNGGAPTQLAAGSLDPSGAAYLITSSLPAGTHSITMTYTPAVTEVNFTGGTSAAFTLVVPATTRVSSTTTLTVTNPSITYGGSIYGTVAITSSSNNTPATGTVNLMSGTTMLGSCVLSGGSCVYILSGVGAGVKPLTASYTGDATYLASTSSSTFLNVARVILQVTAINQSASVGGVMPGLTYSISGFVNSETQASAVTGAPSLSTTATNTATVGLYPISISAGTLAAANYSFTFTSGYLSIVPVSQATAVATGDSRTVTEPQFPAVCQQLTAALLAANGDIPASVDATVTNPDGVRIQAALNACSGTGQAVELSIDGSGNNAFLTGPLSMPSNVTLLVDPGVTLFFSRNVQDYDSVAGTHTCGTVNNNSATSSCLPLIDIPGTSTKVGIMGYGKLDGRGGDTLINAIAPYGGFSWWGLSNAANGVGNQQNPRFIQMDAGSSYITLYKITVKNSPLFHVSTTGAVSYFTAWDVKIVTPTSSRNTDGIDPGNATNFTITRSWISDGDDNVAVGGAGTTAPASNISVTNNHFFAGHGESIGSYTSAGVSNLLFDGNMGAGNGVAAVGSAITSGGTFGLGGVADPNSTAIRIKSANDRGGVVTNIQYSNSCFLDHKSDIQFTPLYNTNTGTATPNFENILIQNAVFLNDSTAGGAGTVQFTGAQNGATINPLTVTLDNVTFPSALSTTSFVTTGTAGTETNAQLTYGPGQISTNFVNAWATFAPVIPNGDGDTVAGTPSGSLLPPQCNFTYIAPELTGPNGLPQTISQGQNATLVVILTPAVGGAAYPTGTVTLTDAFNGATTTVTLTGTSDTIEIPVSGLAPGTHAFTATYSGDTNYPLNGATYYTLAGPHTVTVNAASLSTTTTTLSVTPATAPYGSPFTATATVTGSNPTGTIEFLVNSVVYTTSAVSSGTASATINLPYSTTAYSIVAVYSGDSVNAGSTSSPSTVTVTPALTTTVLSANTATTTLGHPVVLTATVSPVDAGVGTVIGTVNFTYTTPSNSTPVALASATLNNGVAVTAASLPLGTNYITANYLGTGSFAASTSSATTVTVGTPSIIPLPKNPIALPYTISTIAGGGLATVPTSGNMACTGATDKYGDGCQATAISLSTGDDLRGVTADPFGNVYFTESVSKLTRKIAPNGVISNFAGRVSGTACVPTWTTGCAPTLVGLSGSRGVASDLAGNIYIADYNGKQVYEVRVADGLMYLVAGTGTNGYTGDGGPATSAEVNAPRGAWGDTVGNIYIADTSNNVVRVVDSTGTIHTFAGNGTAGTIGDSGPATSAELSNPQGVYVDPNLNVYIADSSNNKIRVVCVTCGTSSPLDTLLASLGIASAVNGDIYTIAGGASATYGGTYPTLGTNVKMSAPQKLAADLSGNLYISDGNGIIWFLDARTAQIRPIASNAATVCAGATDTVGDGCPATQAKFGNGGNGIGVGVDALGNMYIADTADLLIRKVSTNLASASVATASTLTAPVELHFIAGDSLASTNGLVENSTEWLLSTPTCTTNADTTADCMFTSSFTPAVPGARSTPLVANSSAGNSANLALTGTGLGAGATLDPASHISFGSKLQVAGLALDAAGNVYVSDSTSKNLLRFAAAAISQGSSATGTTLATLVAPGAVTVDQRGYVYVADTSAGTVTQISPAGTSATLPFTFTTPSGLAVDAVNNLYVSDSSKQTIYQISPLTGAQHTLPMGILVAPAGLFIDPSGNLLIADPGAGALYRFNLQTNSRTTVSTNAAKPSAVVTDAAGNLLIADTASLLAVPASSNSASFTVASLAPSALAIDATGNLFTGSQGSVLTFARTQGYLPFSAGETPQTVNLLESGNQEFTATSFTQTDTTDYSLTPNASADCTLNANGAGTLAIGGVCALTAAYTPTTFATTTDTVTFNGNFTNVAAPSSLQLILTGPVTPPTATITLGVSPTSPVYGQSVTVKATVIGASLPPTGSVVFTVNSNSVPGALVNGAWTATLTNLPVGSYSLSAAYTSTDGYAPATSSTVSFSVGQATPTITWASPAAITYGTPLSATQLDASANVAGKFVYSPAAGTIIGGGSQTLTVTFTPTDTTNYTTATASVSLTVSSAMPAIALVSSASPVFVSNPVTLTATLSSSTGTPTGSVSFYSGTTLLGNAAITSGVAAFTTSALTTGTDSITATYSGDSNFVAVTSAATSELVEDFTIASPSGSSSSATAPPGGQAAYLLLVAPQGGSTFPQAINLTVTGLPTGATATFSPSATIATGSGSTNVSLTVVLPSTTSAKVEHRPFGTELPVALGLILLPFLVRLRKGSRLLNDMVKLVVLGIAGAALMTGLSGCGGSVRASSTYTLTVTATSGSLSHSTTLTLAQK